MKRHITSILLITTLSILTLIIVYKCRFDIEFKYHVYKSDRKLYNGDFLHPTYAYLKNEKLIGIEHERNLECGQTNIKYFFNKNEKLNKIIYEIDFFSEHCGVTYDSIYIIKANNDKILIFDSDGNHFNKKGLKEMITSFDTKEFKTEISAWKK